MRDTGKDKGRDDFDERQEEILEELRTCVFEAGWIAGVLAELNGTALEYMSKEQIRARIMADYDQWRAAVEEPTHQ